MYNFNDLCPVRITHTEQKMHKQLSLFGQMLHNCLCSLECDLHKTDLSLNSPSWFHHFCFIHVNATSILANVFIIHSKAPT